MDYLGQEVPNSQTVISGSDSQSGHSTLAVQASNLTIDNIESIGTTINDLRTSVKIQEWLEKNARAGSRYAEQLLARFGVKYSDARLQRSQFLSGGKQPIVVSEVLANFGSAEIAQGNMAGHGVSVGNTMQFKKYFEEHGIVMGIMSILPRTAYYQGVDKEF